MIFPILSLVLIFGIAACVSVERRIKKGEAMEDAGRFEEAAQAYIRALEKDPNREDVRGRLESAGTQAVDALLRRAYALESTEAYEDVLAVINRIDSLRSRSADVGVALPVPDDYAGFREEMTAAAIDSLFRQGEQAEQSGDWAGAVRSYSRLKNNYSLSSTEIRQVNEALGGSFINWAEQDLANAFYRDSFNHAQQAIDILGPDGTAGMYALEIQQAALDEGTRTVAVLPFWLENRVGRDVSRGKARELYDVTLYEYLDEPVLFVVFAEPGDIHREIRRLNLRDQPLSRQMAARVGQNLGVDFVVIGWVDSFVHEENILQEETHRVPLRSDKTRLAEYVEQRYRLRITAAFAYRIIDSFTRRNLYDDTFREEVSDQFNRGIYDGDFNNLDLSRSERRLFNAERLYEDEQDLEDRLTDKIAERLADNLRKRILGMIR